MKEDRNAQDFVLVVDQTEALEKLGEALQEVRRRFDAGADDWQYGLLRTFRQYLLAIGTDRRPAGLRFSRLNLSQGAPRHEVERCFG